MRFHVAAAMAAVLLCAASLGSAQTTPLGPGQFKDYGPGTQSCGTWLAERGNLKPTAIEKMQQYVLGSWVLGWVSAAGYYNVQGAMRVTDANAIEAWVDNYCRANPLNDLHQAAAALVDELSKTK